MAQLTLEGDCLLHYQCYDGDPAKPCLLFLHEGLGCTAMWKDFPRRLCKRTRSSGLSYDRIGYGLSSPLRSARTLRYLHEAALQELTAVIARLLPDRPYILVGHSDGGSIALILGAERPPLLRGIVTEAAHVFVEPQALDGIRAAKKAFELGRFAGLAKYHGDKATAIFRAWSETWLTEEFMHWNIEALLPAIRCPVLAIQGRDDQYGTAAQVEAIVSGVGARARALLIDDCGHSPHAEQPERVLEAMAAFIAGCLALPELGGR